MGNRIATTIDPIIMTAEFLEEKVIQYMVHMQDLDMSELQKLVKIDGIENEAVFSFHLESQSNYINNTFNCKYFLKNSNKYFLKSWNGIK